MISPLLSRSLLLSLEPLTADDIREVIDRRWSTSAVSVAGSRSPRMRRTRWSRIAAATPAVRSPPSRRRPGQRHARSRRRLATAVDRAAVRYDRDGDQHYDVASAFIKSIRGSDVDAGLHYLARMIEAGEDPRFIARRLVILASEDIGLADPTALHRGRGPSGGRVHRLSRGLADAGPSRDRAAAAPKSNAVMLAYQRRRRRAAGLVGPVPTHLRDSHYPGAAKLGPRHRLPLPARRAGGVVASDTPQSGRRPGVLPAERARSRSARRCGWSGDSAHTAGAAGDACRVGPADA